VPNATWCPWNFYRTSGDVRASFDSIMGNLATVIPLADKNLSTPGCWAYPDMLEVGCAHGPGGAGDPGLTLGETRSHFGAWSIVSSPLTLSHDVTNNSLQDLIWPIIANREALAVNQNYYGHSGSAFYSSVQPPVTTGDFVLVFTCNASDATQLGFSYDVAAQAIIFGGRCVDAADGAQVMLAECSGSPAQTWSYNSATKNFVDKKDGNCLDVWASLGPPGGPGVQTYGCHGAQGQQWTINANASTISANADDFCLASRAAVPHQLKYLYKPMSWDGKKAAVLLINVDAQPADLSVSFADVPGLRGSQCVVRDIWNRKDVGNFTATFTAAAVGAHDSAFLMLTCA
jgi:hypothetical protein